jgi:lipid-A-disaccharide synthase
VDTVRQTAAAVDFSLVASGSATLEVASSGCPMVVMYQTNRVLWQLAGRWLVHPKFFTLVNLLADRELVPEFMPYFTSINPIVQRIDSYLQDARLLTRTSHDLIDMVEPLTHKKASEEVARVVVEMLS